MLTPVVPSKGAVVANFLAMNNDQTKKELEGQRESKAQALVLQGAVLIMMDPITLGCVIGKLCTTKAVH